jgi:hypothetical protein
VLEPAIIIDDRGRNRSCNSLIRPVSSRSGQSGHERRPYLYLQVGTLSMSFLYLLLPDVPGENRHDTLPIIAPSPQ